LAPRTAAGAGADGRTAYLVTVDGRLAGSAGMTVAELADLLRSMGAAIAVNVDGGGSSTIAVREPGQPAATIKNLPSDGTERPVANGIGVFSRG
jgi:exopolysaccharide biosynthesis protein